MSFLDPVERDYHSAFLGHLVNRSEVSLERGYEMGRRSVEDGVNLLDLAVVHHAVFGRVLAETRTDELDDIVAAAAEFFLEVLAPYHMSRPARPV